MIPNTQANSNGLSCVLALPNVDRQAEAYRTFVAHIGTFVGRIGRLITDHRACKVTPVSPLSTPRNQNLLEVLPDVD
jgi:hypothetical protein